MNKNTNGNLTFLDLFAGIGGFRLGMEQAGHECIGYVEIDKFARKSYEAIHDTKGEWTAHDITKVSDDDIRSLRGRVDVITGGFPCQAFSIAGKRKGFDDTRGTLFFDIARFANILRPRYLFLENVRGLLSHDNGNTFETIIRTLDDIGYDCEWDLLNSKDFGVPQNRERVFIIGHLRGGCTRKVFPVRGTNGEVAEGHKALGADFRYDEGLRIRGNGIAPCLKANNYKMGKENLDLSNGVFAVLTPDREGIRIRRLTPKECWRLQGFPDWAFDKAAEVNSDSQLYKQAGNSVTVNVIYEIAKKLGGIDNA